MPSPWVTRSVAGQLPLALPDVDVRTSHERYIDAIAADLAVEAAYTRDPWQTMESRMDEVTSARVGMGVLSHDEYREVMRQYRS